MATIKNPHVKSQLSQADGYTCKCGNTAVQKGFWTCDRKGNPQEATVESSWDGTYRCDDCGQIIHFVS